MFEKGGKLRKFRNFAKKGGIFKPQKFAISRKKGVFFYTQKREKGVFLIPLHEHGYPKVMRVTGPGVKPDHTF